MVRQRNATPTLNHYLNRLPRRGRRRPSASADPDETSLDNLGLVVAIARRYWFDGVSLDDLVQAGNLGLVRAARSFDRRRGTNLATWLSFGIRQAIVRHLAANQHVVALPRNVHQRLLATGSGGVTRRYRAVSLDGPAGADGSERTTPLLPVCVDEAPAAAELTAMVADVENLLDTLDDAGRRLVVERFGLDGGPPRGTMDQAADRGVSREAIRLRYNTAMARLAAEARARRLEVWLDDS